jgi:hypothetical protein
MKEDYMDSLDQNFIMLTRELGFATQNAIVENLESLDEAPSRQNLLQKLRGGGNKPRSND